MKQEIIAVAAMTKKRVIGKDNWLPWKIPEELAHFRKITQNGVVIMGGATYRSINRPMPDRVNIVISRTMQDIPGVIVKPAVNEALQEAKRYHKPIFIIGGSQIFEQTMSFLDKMYLSFIKKEYEGDIYFPEWDEDLWEIEKKEDHPEFEFVIFKRRKI